MSREIAARMINEFDDNDDPVFQNVTSVCDIFSVGVILWQMIYGIHCYPFDEARENDSKY